MIHARRAVRTGLGVGIACATLLLAAGHAMAGPAKESGNGNGTTRQGAPATGTDRTPSQRPDARRPSSRPKSSEPPAEGCRVPRRKLELLV